MLSLKQNPSPAETSPGELSRALNILFKDLELFVSFCIARFIVWLTLRRRRQEHAARRRQLKLIRGGNHQAGRGAVTQRT